MIQFYALSASKLFMTNDLDIIRGLNQKQIFAIKENDDRQGGQHL